MRALRDETYHFLCKCLDMVSESKMRFEGISVYQANNDIVITGFPQDIANAVSNAIQKIGCLHFFKLNSATSFGHTISGKIKWDSEDYYKSGEKWKIEQHQAGDRQKYLFKRKLRK